MRPALALILSLTAAPAVAHEFDLLLLAPPGATAQVLDQMRTAFLIASHERDNHPDETSEGHLGGMDVQLTMAHQGGAEAGADPVFVVVPMAAPGDPALAAFDSAVVVHGGHLAALATGLDQGDATLPAFADRFRTETGGEPGPEAIATYLGARLVDLVVRPLNSTDDRDALRKALAVP